MHLACTNGKGAAVTVVRRSVVLGTLVLGAVGIPVGLAVSGHQASQPLADPCGGINMSILSEGVPVNMCPAPDVPPATSGGAPTQGTLTHCSGVPGCLSNALYGPGNVVVPVPNTTVQQSQ